MTARYRLPHLRRPIAKPANTQVRAIVICLGDLTGAAPAALEK